MSGEIKRETESKIAEIDEKIRALKSMKKAHKESLEQFLDGYYKKFRKDMK